jgi:hypothetical protein
VSDVRLRWAGFETELDARHGDLHKILVVNKYSLALACVVVAVLNDSCALRAASISTPLASS